MALIRCPDCGKPDVAAYAAACPACGRPSGAAAGEPLLPGFPIGKYLFWGIIAAFLAGFLWILFVSGPAGSR